MACYALEAGRKIRPCSVKIDDGYNAQVYSEWYRDMSTNFFVPQLSRINVPDLYLQQGLIYSIINQLFFIKIISRNEYFNWPPRSSDLASLGSFFGDINQS